MLESRPSHSPGTLFGYILLAGIILLDSGLLWLMAREPITILSFLWGLLLLVSLPAIALVAYSTSSLSAMRYHVVGNALLIEWGRIRQVVPLAQIQALVPGEKLAAITKFRGIRWPGCLIGRGHVRKSEQQTGEADLYDTVFYATRPLSQQLLLITDSVAYGVSPMDLENFADCLTALRLSELANTAEIPASRFSFLAWSLWRDRLAQMMWAASLALNGFLFAYLCAIYSHLPALVPLHFNERGIADRVEAPINLFVLPLVGLIVWLVNGVIGWFFYHWRDEQSLAFILWGAAIAVQLATWAALLSLLA
ncbi:MAG TPA: PH domain-containing protein [Anaerolineae bacterium]